MLEIVSQFLGSDDPMVYESAMDLLMFDGLLSFFGLNAHSKFLWGWIQSVQLCAFRVGISSVGSVSQGHLH
jgi:hypothetical protein